MNRDEAEVEQAVREILVEHSACCVRRGAVGGLGDALMDDLAHRLAVRDRVVAATAAETAQGALDRVVALHTQASDLGMAPGKWCPACGHETPCPTILATLTPPPYLGHLSREELRQRAMDYDEDEETAQRLRESAPLAAAAHPDEEGQP